ncbi:cilia- and flagella-associated protein 157 [Betta splendens]|uniref:Cilia- and flagella-associated protein 157 n=1 Tax=Betta splendens TaxID=158456 RepID=A0A6P7NGI4_BETSP|nr:cilia- and flagella-associated protein 157 [Betta splendens]
MPKKKNKKDDYKQDKEKDTAADNSSATDKEKDVYLTQIRYLNEQLERYQLKCDDLETHSKDFTAQYITLEKEKKDIVEFLKRSLLEKEDEVDVLTERLERQRQDADRDRDAVRLQQSQLMQKLQGQIEELTGERDTLEARLAGLEEFQQQKEQLMAKVETLETQLAQQEVEHKTNIHNLEMKALLENKRLEKEMESHMAAMSEKVQKQVDQNLPEATRMALQENTELKVQLNQMSELAKNLMKKNSALQGCKNQLRLDVELLEKMMSEVSRQSCVHKKVVEQLTEKCQQMQEEQRHSRHELQHVQAKHKETLAEMEALRQEQAALSDLHSKSKAEGHRLEAELEKERRKSSRMKSILQEAAVTLRQALMEAPAELESVHWKKVMQKLLLDLNGPTQDEQNPDPAAARTVHLDPASRVQFQLARYRPGDLGLVPPPAHKHRLSRTGAAPGSTATALHRKPSSQKTTACNPKHSAAGRFDTKLK